MNSHNQLDELSAAVVAACSTVAAAGRSLDRLGLASGGTGNISVRVDGAIVITPTGSSLGALTETGLSVLGSDGNPRQGPAPSKEAPLHVAFYQQRPSASAVIHLHSDHATAVSCLPPWSTASALPPVTSYFLMKVGPVPLIPFAPPGSPQLADFVAGLPASTRAALLANHGPIVAGETLAECLDVAIELEAAARVHLLSRGPDQRHLHAAEIDEVRTRFGISWDGEATGRDR